MKLTHLIPRRRFATYSLAFSKRHGLGRVTECTFNETRCLTDWRFRVDFADKSRWMWGDDLSIPA